MQAVAKSGMRWVPGGTFRMGSDRHYPEEAPAHEVTVGGFWIDQYEITNRDFAAFVAASGYRSVEQPPNPADYPGALPHLLKPGSLVFHKTRGPVDLRDISNWWCWKIGAYWRHPEGKGSSVAGRLDHPVVHIAFEDAQAIRGARRIRRRRVRLGQRPQPRQTPHGQRLAGRVPLAKPAHRRVREDLAGRLFSTQWLWPL